MSFTEWTNLEPSSLRRSPNKKRVSTDSGSQSCKDLINLIFQVELLPKIFPIGNATEPSSSTAFKNKFRNLFFNKTSPAQYHTRTTPYYYLIS